MPVNICADNFRAHSTGFVEPGTLPAGFPDPLSVYARILLDVEDHRKRGIPSHDIGWQDRYQSDEEVKKDLLSEVILVAWLLSFHGQEPFIFHRDI